MGSMNNLTIALYQKQIVDIGFERAGLFKALQARYAPVEALYPGSSVHITPSLFFPHVVYVDHSPTAVEFFADMDSIQRYVNRKKHYKQRAYIRFIDQDFTTSLALSSGGFDLLISLYAGGVSRACKGYLKLGGIVVTNNHQHDVDDLVNDASFQLRSVIKNVAGKYRTFDEDLGEFLAAARQGPKAKKYLRSTSRGAAYREDIDSYFVFERHS